MSNPKIWPPNLLCTMMLPAPAAGFGWASSICPTVKVDTAQKKPSKVIAITGLNTSCLFIGVPSRIKRPQGTGFQSGLCHADVNLRQFICGLLKRLYSRLDGHAVMRRYHLPLPAHLHPDIGQAIVILVRLALGFPFFVIGAGHNGRVAMHPNLEVRKFRHLYLGRCVCTVADVARLAVDIPVFD